MALLNQKTYQDNQSCSLLEKTRELLLNDPRSSLELFRLTNLHPFWISQFRAGKTGNSSVARVQFLYEFLSGKTLDV